MDIFAYAPWLNNEVVLTALWIIVFIWAFVWKGIGLWTSAKQNQKFWFIAILTLNTAGLLEIIYLFYFAKNKLTIAILAKGTKNTFTKIKTKAFVF